MNPYILRPLMDPLLFNPWPIRNVKPKVLYFMAQLMTCHQMTYHVMTCYRVIRPREPYHHFFFIK